MEPTSEQMYRPTWPPSSWARRVVPTLRPGGGVAAHDGLARPAASIVVSQSQQVGCFSFAFEATIRGLAERLTEASAGIGDVDLRDQCIVISPLLATTRTPPLHQHALVIRPNI